MPQSKSKADESADCSSKKSVSYGISKSGNAYRSFRLISIGSQHAVGNGSNERVHCAVNRSKSTHNTSSTTSHLGPLRGAQKIFDMWCRENKKNVVGNTPFCIQETTRGKTGKLYRYTGRREKLDEPRRITIAGQDKPIVYHYRSRVHSLRTSGTGTGEDKGAVLESVADVDASAEG